MSALLDGSIVLVFMWLLAGSIGLPLPEDFGLLSAGVLIHRGIVEPVVGMAVVFAAVLLGDGILFYSARRLGPAAYNSRLGRKLLPPARRERLEQAFQRHGGRMVFIGRHLAGLRAAVFAMAGINRVRPRTFFVWDAIAACITVPTTVVLGWLGSEHADRMRAGVARVEHHVLMGAAVALLVYISWRHMRLIRGRRAAATESPAGAPAHP
jgi:membrane protein DedA with SNARE-associated domain